MMETTSGAGTFGGSSPHVGPSEKRVLTVGYIVTQTLKIIAQMVIQARVLLGGAENDYTGQWLNLKVYHSGGVDEELQKVTSLSKSSDGTPSGLVIEIFADLSKHAKELQLRRGQERILLERWTMEFSSQSVKTGETLPATINDKLSIVLIRSIYSVLRLLPAHNLVRHCKKKVTPYTIGYSLSSPASTVNIPPSPISSSPPSRPSSSLPTREPLREKGKKEKEKRRQTSVFTFAPIVSESGTLSACVEYKKDLASLEDFSRFTIDPYVISDYTPTRSAPISIGGATVQRPITAQSAPAGFHGSPFKNTYRNRESPEKEAYHTSPPSAYRNSTPLLTPQSRKEIPELFRMSPSPPLASPFLPGNVSSSAPSSSTPIEDIRPPSPFIISNATLLSSSPSDDSLEPELNSFYVRDRYGRRTLSISPSSSPPSPRMSFTSDSKDNQKGDIYFSAMLPPEGVDEPQFGGEFIEEDEDEQSLSDIDRFSRMCSHPPQLQMFSEVKPVAWADELRELQQFLNDFAS